MDTCFEDAIAHVESTPVRICIAIRTRVTHHIKLVDSRGEHIGSRQGPCKIEDRAGGVQIAGHIGAVDNHGGVIAQVVRDAIVIVVRVIENTFNVVVSIPLTLILTSGLLVTVEPFAGLMILSDTLVKAA